jgi:ribosome biogenesis GTPase
MRTAHGPEAASPEPPDDRRVLAELGWDDDRAAAWAQLIARRWPALARARASRTELTPARVAGLRPGGPLVLTGQGPAVLATASGVLLAAIAADPVAAPCLGDWVVLRAWPDRRHTVEWVLPRRGVLLAPAGGHAGPGPGDDGSPMPIAANVDVLLVAARAVASDVRRLAGLVRRAEAAGLDALVLLTEAGQPAAGDVEALAAALPGAPLTAVSTTTGAGLDLVRARVGPARSAVLLGAAGPARRALLRALVSGPPGAAQVLGLTRRASPGLLPLRGGGVLLDPPGPGQIADSASFGKARDPASPVAGGELIRPQAGWRAGAAATRPGGAGLRRPPD